MGFKLLTTLIEFFKIIYVRIGMAFMNWYNMNTSFFQPARWSVSLGIIKENPLLFEMPLAQSFRFLDTPFSHPNIRMFVHLKKLFDLLFC